MQPINRKQCGAKCRNGKPCPTPGMPNGRCRMHGGTNPGRPVTTGTGRGARYARLLGGTFAECLRDPDLLKADAELALFDTFLIERAEVLRDGFSSAWIDDLKAVAETIDQAAKQADAGALKGGLARLKELAAQGGDRQQAWGEALTAAKQRSDIAAKADANVARREAGMAESAVLGHLVKLLEIFRDVAGDGAALKARSRFEVEVLGRVGQRDPGPVALAAGGAERVH